MSAISIIRGIIKDVWPSKWGGPSRVAASGRDGEEFSDREMFQQYGMSSRPMEGAECLVIRSGQSIFVIGTDDRHFKIALEEGEVAVHDAFENVIHLQKGGNILVDAGNGSGAVTVKANKAIIDADDVLFGPENMETAAGTVLTTTNCICPYTASPHVIAPGGSERVKTV